MYTKYLQTRAGVFYSYTNGEVVWECLIAKPYWHTCCDHPLMHWYNDSSVVISKTRSKQSCSWQQNILWVDK